MIHPRDQRKRSTGTIRGIPINLYDSSDQKGFDESPPATAIDLLEENLSHLPVQLHPAIPIFITERLAEQKSKMLTKQFVA